MGRRIPPRCAWGLARSPTGPPVTQQVAARTDLVTQTTARPRGVRHAPLVRRQPPSTSRDLVADLRRPLGQRLGGRAAAVRFRATRVRAWLLPPRYVLPAGRGGPAHRQRQLHGRARARAAVGPPRVIGRRGARGRGDAANGCCVWLPPPRPLRPKGGRALPAAAG